MNPRTDLEVRLVPLFKKEISTQLGFIILIRLAMLMIMVHARYDLLVQVYSLRFSFQSYARFLPA